MTMQVGDGWILHQVSIGEKSCLEEVFEGSQVGGSFVAGIGQP